MYGCESWTIKKVEQWRIDSFEVLCWRRLLRVLWSARRWNQSILKEISPEYSLEGLMLKLMLQYFGHVMQRADLLKKTLMLENTEGRRKRGWQRMRWLDDMSLSKLREIVKDREVWHAVVQGVTKGQTWLRDWTTTWVTVHQHPGNREEKLPPRTGIPTCCSSNCVQAGERYSPLSSSGEGLRLSTSDSSCDGQVIFLSCLQCPVSGWS